MLHPLRSLLSRRGARLDLDRATCVNGASYHHFLLEEVPLEPLGSFIAGSDPAGACHPPSFCQGSSRCP